MLAQIAGFPIRALLGAGAQGEVFLAERPDGTLAALKVLAEGADRARAVALVARLATLAHPSLVRVVAVHDHEGRVVLEMDHVDGSPLIGTLRAPRVIPLTVRPTLPVAFGQPLQEGNLSAFTALDDAATLRLERYVAQIASALATLHENGLVHRDVRPENILVAGDRAVLLDVGLVTDDAEGDDQAGTAAYLAPDDLTGPAADLYALGVVLFEALTGALPFLGSAQEVVVLKGTVSAPAPSFVVKLRPTAARLDALTIRLLRRVAAQRPTAAEVVALLSG
ncbi:MAG: serine/threonine protein kinase [Myxococcales bacterium]|nr:serine/threonine protein kinase [Myxococcales bacterium]